MRTESIISMYGRADNTMTGDKEIVEKIKTSEQFDMVDNTDAEAVGSVRPLGNGIDRMYGLSQDLTEISLGSDVAGQYRGIG